jgi:hypothetical protein
MTIAKYGAILFLRWRRCNKGTIACLEQRSARAMQSSVLILKAWLTLFEAAVTSGVEMEVRNYYRSKRSDCQGT